ncbi:hypothetical protein FE257_003247 [Aspergillus nanangensis]|uniref:Uncharacterized protein n=1 Tax=Aspergillus nanangensis TaxID=2582783 RepID=A0AAD4CS78_ASPNN|nr:hypothetical protein FE257_003247 [Aspergillus nanangensis]
MLLVSSLLANVASALLLLFLLPFATAIEQSPPNANHIFNALHASMRQWGSSLHHNGMSFFLATVPKGTQLYHGGYSRDPVNGTEWLAFEPEHAMVFTKPFPHGPPPPREGSDGTEIPPPPTKENEGASGAPGGWLHTYTAANDLRLLYADGMSAGKTGNGTLDSQDRILFRDALSGHPFEQEKKRADLFCRMVREDWKDRLDGIIRMEAGFEIILCDFARNLDRVRVTQVKSDHKPQNMRHRLGPRPGKGQKELDGARLWFRAIAARYDGIGGNRVTLNYDTFVTTYAYGLDLFRSPDGGISGLPRLKHLSADELEPIRADLNKLIMDHDTKALSFNWQSIADMVVDRYARELRYLASGQLSTIDEIHEEIESSLGPFIDYSDRNASNEIDRCTAQFLPAAESTESTAGGAVRLVAHRICATLIDIWTQSDYETALVDIQKLMKYLSWTTWKECGGCADNEICVVPMWPMGTVEDYDHPQCREASRPNGDGRRYWGGSGAPSSLSWFQRLSHSLQTIMW